MLTHMHAACSQIDWLRCREIGIKKGESEFNKNNLLGSVEILWRKEFFMQVPALIMRSDFQFSVESNACLLA